MIHASYATLVLEPWTRHDQDARCRCNQPSVYAQFAQPLHEPMANVIIVQRRTAQTAGHDDGFHLLFY